MSENFLKIGDEIELIPEKLVYEGSAIARAGGFPVFVDGACPGDKLKVKITKANKNYAPGISLK